MAKQSTEKLKRRYLRKLFVIAQRLSREFDLPFKALHEEYPNSTRWGACSKDGHIWIRLNVLGKPNRLLSWWRMVYELSHELAHLRHFHHKTEFWFFYGQLWAEVKRRGYHKKAPR